MSNYQKGKELAERFWAGFDGLTFEDLQRNLTGRADEMWPSGQ